MQDILNLKADKTEMFKLQNEKVNREEFISLIPTNDPRELVKEEIKNEIEFLTKNFDELSRSWDLKLVKLRNEFDLHTVKK